jgi:hypothetical protein
MARDYSRFPADENGDALWRMAEAGDDLTKPREVDFAVIFPTEGTALQFAVHLLRNGQKVSFVRMLMALLRRDIFFGAPSLVRDSTRGIAYGAAH